MKTHDIPICLFYNPGNIRYATGCDVMGVWTATTLARYCLVAIGRDPILFEYPNSCMSRSGWCATSGRRCHGSTVRPRATAMPANGRSR